MTLEGLHALYFTRLREKNPLHFSDAEKLESVKDLWERLTAESDFRTLLRDVFSEVHVVLCEEMGVAQGNLRGISPSMPLPPRANALAESLRNFLPEFTG